MKIRQKNKSENYICSTSRNFAGPQNVHSNNAMAKHSIYSDVDGS